MTILLLVPTVLSFLCLGAHYMHQGSLVMTGASALMPLLLLLRRPFIRVAFQGLLVLAAVEWVLTLPEVIRIKREMGGPVMIDVYILGGVAAFNIVAALLLQTRRVRRYFAGSAAVAGPGVPATPR